MRAAHWLLVLLIGGLAGYAGARLGASSSAAPILPPVESAYERVMRTNELRCGYILYEPMVRRDPNNGAFSGAAVELAETIGALLNLKIVWAEEVGFGNAIEGLRTRRYDALCVGFWRIPLEGKLLYYTQPFAYSLDEVLVRADDMRFDEDIRRINQPDITIISSDGMEGSRIARRDFPQAKLIELPNMASESDLLESVAAGKADVLFEEAAVSERYMAANPGKLKKLALPTPIRIFQNSFALPQDEKLKAMLDTAINDLVENGGMDLILDKYDPQQRLLLRIKRPGLR